MTLENNTIYGTTFQFAEKNGIKAETALKRHCLTGSYFGIVPKKKSNGHLLWPLVVSWEIDTESAKEGGK